MKAFALIFWLVILWPVESTHAQYRVQYSDREQKYKKYVEKQARDERELNSQYEIEREINRGSEWALKDAARRGLRMVTPDIVKLLWLDRLKKDTKIGVGKRRELEKQLRTGMYDRQAQDEADLANIAIFRRENLASHADAIEKVRSERIRSRSAFLRDQELKNENEELQNQMEEIIKTQKDIEWRMRRDR